MSLKKLAAPAVMLLCLSACSTIHFDNGPINPDADKTVEGETWHSDGALALVEFSDPFDLRATCGPGSHWNTIQTQQNVIQSILTGITLTLYAPWDIQYSCVKGAAATVMPRPQSPMIRKRKRHS